MHDRRPERKLRFYIDIPIDSHSRLNMVSHRDMLSIKKRTEYKGTSLSWNNGKSHGQKRTSNRKPQAEFAPCDSPWERLCLNSGTLFCRRFFHLVQNTLRFFFIDSRTYRGGPGKLHRATKTCKPAPLRWLEKFWNPFWWSAENSIKSDTFHLLLLQAWTFEHGRKRTRRWIDSMSTGDFIEDIGYEGHSNDFET